MKIILANGKELNPILASGAPKFIQGQTRDALDFIFPADADMAELDAAFTPAACAKIIISADDGEYIHSGYIVRAGLSKQSVEVQKATPETAAVYEERITVSMAQATFAEMQLAALTDTVDVLVLESLMV